MKPVCICGHAFVDHHEPDEDEDPGVRTCALCDCDFYDPEDEDADPS